MLSQEELDKLKQRLSKNPINIPTSTQNTGGASYIDRIKQDYVNTANKTTAEIKNTQSDMGDSTNPLKIGKELAEGGLRTAGNIASLAFAPLTEAVAPVVQPLVEKIASIPGVSNKIQDISAWANQHPDAAKNLEAVLNISMLGGGKVAEPIAKGVADSTVKGVGKAIESVGTASKSAGKALYGISVPMEKPTSIALQSYQASKPTLTERVSGLISGNVKKTLQSPITEAETAARIGLAGTEWQLGVQAKKATDKLWSGVIEPALKSSKQQNNMVQFFDDLKARIISETPDLSRRNTLIKAWNSLKSDYGKVNIVSDLKLQNYKEGWAKFIPEKAYRGEPIAGALNEVRNMAAQEARSILYSKLGKDIKQAYIDYGNLHSIMEAGIKSIDPLRSKSAFKQAWEFMLDKTVTPVATYSGMFLYKTGNGLEFIGQQGAKKVKDIFGSAGLSIKNVNQVKKNNSLSTGQAANKSANMESMNNDLIKEAKKYKSAEEFVNKQTLVYHGSSVPLKSFSNKKGGVYFTEDYADATGFAGSPDNVYEGYLNLKKPLVIDAKGAKWDELNTKYGKSTQEVVSNAEKDGYDGITFKNIVDNIGDTADFGGQSTIHYVYKPQNSFINESQLTDVWNKAHNQKSTIENLID